MIVNILNTCQFSYFTVDGAFDVNLKTQFASNSKIAYGRRTLSCRVLQILRQQRFLTNQKSAAMAAPGS